MKAHIQNRASNPAQPSPAQPTQPTQMTSTSNNLNKEYGTCDACNTFTYIIAVKESEDPEADSFIPIELCLECMIKFYSSTASHSNYRLDEQGYKEISVQNSVCDECNCYKKTICYDSIIDDYKAIYVCEDCCKKLMLDDD